MSFELAQGIDIPSADKLKNTYCVSRENKGCISAVLSAELISKLLRDFTAHIRGPVFFFIELPCTSEEEKQLAAEGSENRPHYKLYYLDNCTKPVIDAIIKTYGSLLVNDGICRFGFGGNESGDEIYIQSYKVISIYCADQKMNSSTIKLLEGLGAEKTEELLTPWDIISESNPSTCVHAEEDGISLFDLPELLSEAGMYYAETV